MITRKIRKVTGFGLLFLLLFAGIAALLFIGPVKISPGEVWRVLAGEGDDPVAEAIVLGSRWPMAVTAVLSGSSLASAGLMMQTVFRNPLAGPSVLGVSTGASLGVAIVMLGAGSALGSLVSLGCFFGALTGSGIVILSLVLVSARVKSNTLLLILGMMVSYLGSSLISLLNFFAPAEGIRSFVVWGMGSLQTVGPSGLWPFAIATLILLFGAVFSRKPLDALLLGEDYARSLGYSVGKMRTFLLILAGLLTAVTSAYCGPIGFIGLVVPHLVRLLLKTGNHRILMPASIVGGAVLMVACAVVSVLPERGGIIPINSITPIVGVPIILLIILRRNRL